MWKRLLLLLAALSLFSQPVLAAVPKVIALVAALTSASGGPAADGDYNLLFTLLPDVNSKIRCGVKGRSR